ncbi:MAG TPA: nuclease-related domain-containing protein [Streptosporangiaceae bacterium]|nr:nuclease-related domain-containing protein [Streptosporangiaceae bacterium]
MPPLHSRVWRRYGQLRIYVSADNDPVGWFDPRTGRSHLSRPDRHDEFWAAVHAECQQLLRDGQISESALPPEVSPTDPWEVPVAQSAASPPSSEQDRVVRDPEWDDLARNAPGASASARARALRREHPLLTGAAAMLGIRTSAQQFAAGARGERAVGRQLNRWATRYGWHVLHAVPVGQRGADIDHVVIGPFGVVTVNTKTTGTAVWVGEYGLTIGGKPVDYLRKSRREADRAGRLLHRATGLEVPVQSAIVFVGARKMTVRRGGPADVAVLPNPRALRRWLCKQSPALQTDQVDAIYEAARRPASWQSG